ncbi:probable C-mannosyltransferase DPY19L3 [Anarrhichthys ocellatus]|uniref:probable C-mannosyltransferase DPY19L3 n=1 Tax=Anarrhichthys ocellatus TaxID=433405 RepID=UPI0012ED1279|nr:probable C-mannosyltransferase DPY19L3 [Anarrhichthys ocellatus]
MLSIRSFNHKPHFFCFHLPLSLYSSHLSRLPPTSCRDFDASLYLCEEAFGLLPLDTLERLAGTLLLYPYALTLLLLSTMLTAAALQNLRPKGGSAEERKGGGEARAAAFRPDVAYNLLHTLFYGLLAFSTMR